jgi:hypothetical protein
VGTRSGNTTAFVTTTGTQTSGDCVKIDANGNHVANGSACGSGGGSGTVSASSVAGALAYYPTGSGSTTVDDAPNLVWDGSATLTIGACGTNCLTQDMSAVTGAKTATWPNSTGNVAVTAGLLSIASGKTATFNHSITFAGTDTTTMTFPSASATIPRTVASGAKTLNTTAVSSGACSSEQTDTATGTATTDAVSISFNGDPTSTTGYSASTAGGLTIFYYPKADAIGFRVCNNTAASITPGAVTMNWRVIR